MNKGAMTPAQLYAHTDRPEWKAAGRQWQGIPAIERTAKGRLYACWYSGGKTEEPGNIIVVEKSDDDGKTWSDGFYTVAHDDPEEFIDLARNIFPETTAGGNGMTAMLRFEER